MPSNKFHSTLFVPLALALSIAGCYAAEETVWSPGKPAPKVEEKYLIGGPVEGIELPANKRSGAPLVEIYPGSVEQWHEYWMKYTPSRSFFDAQSLVKYWNAHEIPGVPKDRIGEFAPPSAKNVSAPVVRTGIKAPVYRLEMGEIPIGLYVVRTIAAVPTDKLRPFRTPLYLTMRVNDKPNGEWSTYRQRISYIDDFYSVAEIFFHAEEARAYRAEVFVDEGSEVELLINSFTLDDALAGTKLQAFKDKRTLVKPAEIEKIKEQYNAMLGGINDKYLRKFQPHLQVETFQPLSKEERLARDRAVWRWMPPLNAQGWGGFADELEIGTADKTAKELAAAHGEWKPVTGRGMGWGGLLSFDPKVQNDFLVNEKLGLKYTIEDLYADKPLPAPYPYQDRGAGFYFPNPNDPKKGRVLAPIGMEVGGRFRSGSVFAETGAKLWLITGQEDFARDAAVNLVRYAYDFPTRILTYNLNQNMRVPTFGNRDTRFRQRMETFPFGEYSRYLEALTTYDLLFPYIKGNEELAQSVNRFVPWVKSSNDVIALIDTYLVQTTAKRIMRYHWYTYPQAIATAAATLGAPPMTEPWMEWLFSKTFVYPLAPAGIQDLMISGTDRSGAEYIGSVYYSQDEGARRTAAGLYPYLEAGGNQKFNLADPKRYPKALQHCYWQLNTIIGGQDFFRIGDVAGPEKAPTFTMREGGLGEAARWGWRWSHDPKFAWILKHQFGRLGETDEQWKAIETAAQQVKRAPWLDLPSRNVPNWAGVLESGLQHDDYRFRRAAWVRAGLGTGHQHADTLDLGGFAHGVPWTVDDGQRSGYSDPNSRFTRIHNTAEVNGGGNTEYGVWTHSWVQNIADTPGARYQRVNAAPPPGAKYFNRQVALIDVDEGSGSQPLTTEQQLPAGKLPSNVTTPNAYIFDVFRISGGDAHNYNFHGTIEDEFTWNAQNAAPVEKVKPNLKPKTEAEYLSIFETSSEPKLACDSPSIFQATWRLTRDEKIGKFAGEQAYLMENYNPNAPRKYTKLHMLNADGLRALKATVKSERFDYDFTNVTLLKQGQNLESAFTAIIEPYAGEPFIASQRVLPVANNETDALRAVAVEVKTKGGHTDVNFADGRPDKVRKVGDMSFSGEYAFVSMDANGLRQATLSGGTLLSTPDIQLKAAQREYSATIANVNYPEKRVQLDKPFPAAASGRLLEVGNPLRWTSYETTQVDGQTVTFKRSADYFRSDITQVLPEQKRVDAKLAPPVGGAPGMSDGWTLTDDEATKFWRVVKANGNDFTVDKAAMPQDFAPGNVMRLWEYGPGDSVRQSTFVSMRRVANNLYELTGDVDIELALRRAKSIEFSTDQKSWRKLGNGSVSVGLGKLSNAQQPVYLRVTQ